MRSVLEADAAAADAIRAAELAQKFAQEAKPPPPIRGAGLRSSCSAAGRDRRWQESARAATAGRSYSGAEPPYAGAIVGARLSLQERHLPGIKSQLAAVNVYALLRDDLQHVATAATLAQAAVAEGKTPGVLTGREASWAGRSEDHERERKEKAERIADYEREWGIKPDEYA